MERELVERILQKYQVVYRTILPAQKGYRNTTFPVVTAGEMLNVIIYKNEPGMAERIQHINKLGVFLHAHSLPARHAYDHRILRLKTDTGAQRFAALYYYVPGNTIPWEAYTMDHIKQLGKAMGDMHARLAHYPYDLPSVADELLALNKRMCRYFAGSGVHNALSKKLGVRVDHADFTLALNTAKNLPGQALHMDFVRGNILFEGTRITGILDFEKAAYGHPVFDVARTLAFLLVDCKYKSAAKTTKYFLQSGYNKRSAAQFSAFAELNQLLPFFLLHDFYKFLRHNPYEYLPQNEHFIRTKAILVKLGVLGVE